jgi:hypothetical protein
MLRLKILAALTSLSLTAQATAVGQGASAHTITMLVPQDLYEYADSLTCDQVSDFYEQRPGVLDPPYLYVDSLLPWWEGTSALWCQPRGGRRDRYTLLFRFGRRSGALAQCPTRIDGVQHIGGLSVVRPKSLSLADFVFVDDQRTSGPKVPATDVAIQEIYDGTGTWFYCYEGRWLAFMLH